VISNAVGIIDTSGGHIADGFDIAMRLPRESGLVIFGNLTPMVIKQQKRVELPGGSEGEGAVKMHSRTFERRLDSINLLTGRTDITRISLSLLNISAIG
jgi:hypothetical protein